MEHIEKRGSRHKQGEDATQHTEVRVETPGIHHGPGAWGDRGTLGDIVEQMRNKWFEIANTPQRIYLGFFLCLVGVLAGGIVFPLMDMYVEPPLLKVGSRNMVLAVGFVAYWYRTVSDVQVVKLTLQKAVNDRSTLVSLVVSGVTHGVASLLSQVALELTGDEVTSVVTNCSCVFAALFVYFTDPVSVSKIERQAAVGVCVLIIYLLVVMQPSFLGVLAGLGVSCTNAVFYVSQKRLRAKLPFVPLMSLVYAQSALYIFISCLYLHPEFGITTWFYVLFNLYYLVPTIIVSFFTAIFQGSLVIALGYCTPIIVTGSLALEPLATFAFDWVLGRPIADLHTMLVLLVLISFTAVISISSSASSRKSSQTSSKHFA